MSEPAPFAIVWQEGEPDSAIATNGFVNMLWLQFRLGLSSYWPNPLHAKRVCTYRPIPDDPFGELEPNLIAWVLEGECQEDSRASKPVMYRCWYCMNPYDHRADTCPHCGSGP